MATTVITVRYLGLVRSIVGSSEERTTVTVGDTVRDLILELSKRHGNDFASIVLARDRSLRRDTTILLNGTDVGDVGGLDAPISEGAEVTIIAMVAPLVGG